MRLQSLVLSGIALNDSDLAVTSATGNCYARDSTKINKIGIIPVTLASIGNQYNLLFLLLL